MSSSTTGDSLSKAYRLIEADELGAALAVLEPLVEAEPDNADAWWLYAHAVSDTFAARRALDQVLRIDPNYPGAAELLQQLEIVSRSDAETEPLPDDTIDTVGFEPPPVLDEEFFEDELDEPELAPVGEVPGEAVVAETPERPSSRSWLPFAALIAVVLIGAVFLLTRPSEDAGDPDQVAGVPSPSPEVGLAVVEPEAVTDDAGDTGEAVVAPEVETDAEAEGEDVTAVDDTEVVTEAEEEPAGDEAASDEPVSEAEEASVDALTAPSTQVAMLPAGPDFTPLVDALADFSVAATDVVEMDTALGNTVVVTVCSQAGSSLRQSLPAVMDVIAARAAVVAAPADAIGARVVNCETERPVRFIVVPKEQAVEYAVGNLTAEEFQATWLPQ